MASETDATESLRMALVDLAVDGWRFARVFERAYTKLDFADQPRFASQFRWFVKRTEDTLLAAGYRLVTLEGQPYDVGAAATAVNIDDFTATDRLVVDQMLEPVVMGPEGIVRAGTMTLRKIES